MSGHWQCGQCGELVPDGESHSCAGVDVVALEDLIDAQDTVGQLQRRVKDLEAADRERENYLDAIHQKDEALETRVKDLEAVAEAVVATRTLQAQFVGGVNNVCFGALLEAHERETGALRAAGYLEVRDKQENKP